MIAEPVLLVNLPVNQSVNFQFLGNFNFHARVFHPKSLLKSSSVDSLALVDLIENKKRARHP